MLHSPSTPTACPPKALTNLAGFSCSVSEPDSSPSNSPTNLSCDRIFFNNGTWFEWYECLDYDINQIATIIVISKISSVFSMLGSSYIIQDVLWDQKKQNESTYHRIMLALSCFDLISSFGHFLGTWAMPQGEQLFAVGTETSCSIVGFFMVTTSYSTPLYNCSLATFYFLKLRLSWINSKIRAIEKWLLLLPLTVGLIVAIYRAAVGGLGPFGYICL